MSHYPVTDARGAALGVSTVVQEITERKRTEEARRELAHASRLALVGELTRRKQWREQRVGRLRLMLLRAREVYDAAAALADRGMFVRERPVR